jgi:hypothetical protein
MYEESKSARCSEISLFIGCEHKINGQERPALILSEFMGTIHK